MTTDSTQDIVDLWTAVYGEPPSITTDHDLMLASLIGGLGPARALAPVAGDALVVADPEAGDAILGHGAVFRSAGDSRG